MVVTRSQTVAKTKSKVIVDSKSPKQTLRVSKTRTKPRRKHVTVTASTRISSVRPRELPEPEGLIFKLLPASFGLMQERIRDSLYALLVQAILWNQTHGLQARPVLFALLALYPSPNELAAASLPALTAMLQPIGLQNIRARRLIALAQAWLVAPPCKERRYRRLHYPVQGAGRDVKEGEVLAEDDKREGWEVAHLPGMGAYALDSYRIFYRDRLRGLEGREGVEPEWKRVVPLDKDLRRYLVWKWSQEGWAWDPLTGRKKLVDLEDNRTCRGDVLP